MCSSGWVRFRYVSLVHDLLTGGWTGWPPCAGAGRMVVWGWRGMEIRLLGLVENCAGGRVFDGRRGIGRAPPLAGPLARSIGREATSPVMVVPPHRPDQHQSPSPPRSAPQLLAICSTHRHRSRSASFPRIHTFSFSRNLASSGRWPLVSPAVHLGEGLPHPRSMERPAHRRTHRTLQPHADRQANATDVLLQLP